MLQPQAIAGTAPRLFAAYRSMGTEKLGGLQGDDWQNDED